MQKNLRYFFIFIVCILTFAANAKEINIIAFNDFHGKADESLIAQEPNPGMAKFVSAILDIEKQNPNYVVVSAGDNYQGSALSNLTHGAIISEMMRIINVQASAVGNHEFDWGQDSFKTWSKEGNFTFLAANILDTKTHHIPSWAKPYLMIKKDGVKIAFIGLATIETPYTTKRTNVSQLKFKNPATVTQYWINYLKAGKAKEGRPNIIIALTHIPSWQNLETREISGKELLNLVEHTNGLNAVITGHSHQVVCGYLHHIPIIQAGKYGQNIGKLKIDLDGENKLEQIVPEIEKIYLKKDSLTPDQQALGIYNNVQKTFKDKIGEVIGYVQNDLIHVRHHGLSPLGKWICDLVRTKFGVQVAILNGGAFRKSLFKGKITVGDIYDILPFDDYIVRFKLSGADLKKTIESGLDDGQFSGVKVDLDLNVPHGKQIRSMTLTDGTHIQADKYYDVAVSDFMWTGGNSYNFSRAKDVVETYIDIRDIIIDSFKTSLPKLNLQVDYRKST